MSEVTMGIVITVCFGVLGALFLVGGAIYARRGRGGKTSKQGFIWFVVGVGMLCCAGIGLVYALSSLFGGTGQ